MPASDEDMLSILFGFSDHNSAINTKITYTKNVIKRRINEFGNGKNQNIDSKITPKTSPNILLGCVCDFSAIK